MPRTAVIELPSRHVVALDPALDRAGGIKLPEGGNYAGVYLSDQEAAKLDTPNAAGFTVDEQGVVTVVPLSPEQLAERQAEGAAAQERTDSTADIRTTYQAVYDRLTAIADDPTTTDTQGEVRQAVVDLARAQRRILRYLKAQAG